MHTVVTPSPTLDYPVGIDSPANLISLQTYDVDRMSGLHRVQWVNINPMFSLCIVFAVNLFPYNCFSSFNTKESGHVTVQFQRDCYHDPSCISHKSH